MAKKKMTAEERAAMIAALEDIREDCGRVMEDFADIAEYTDEDLEALKLCRELGM